MLGESFRTYLHNTAMIQNQHREALNDASAEIEQLLAALPNDVAEMMQGMQACSTLNCPSTTMNKIAF